MSFHNQDAFFNEQFLHVDQERTSHTVSTTYVTIKTLLMKITKNGGKFKL